MAKLKSDFGDAIEKITEDPYNSDILDYFSKDTDILYDDVSSLIMYWFVLNMWKQFAH